MSDDLPGRRAGGDVTAEQEEARAQLAVAARMGRAERFAVGAYIEQLEQVAAGTLVCCKLCGGRGRRPAARAARMRGRKGPGYRTCRSCGGTCYVSADKRQKIRVA